MSPLPGMVAWYRRGIGMSVGAWVDQVVGGAQNFVQATATNQLTPTARGSMLADGVDNYMTATFDLPQPCTIYGLLNTVTFTSGDRLLSGTGPSGGGFIRQQTTTPQVEFSAGAAVGPVSPVLNTVNVITTVWDGANSLIQLNNNAPVTGNAGTRPFNNPTLAAIETPSNFANTDNYEWIFYGAAHSAAQRLHNIHYLASLGGVPL